MSQTIRFPDGSSVSVPEGASQDQIDSIVADYKGLRPQAPATEPKQEQRRGLLAQAGRLANLNLTGGADFAALVAGGGLDTVSSVFRWLGVPENVNVKLGGMTINLGTGEAGHYQQKATDAARGALQTAYDVGDAVTGDNTTVATNPDGLLEEFAYNFGAGNAFSGTTRTAARFLPEITDGAGSTVSRGLNRLFSETASKPGRALAGEVSSEAGATLAENMVRENTNLGIGGEIPAALIGGALTSNPGPLKAAGKAVDNFAGVPLRAGYRAAKEAEGLAGKAGAVGGQLIRHHPYVRAGGAGIRRLGNLRTERAKNKRGRELYSYLNPEAQRVVDRAAESGDTLFAEPNDQINVLTKYLEDRLGASEEGRRLTAFVTNEMRDRIGRAADNLRRAGNTDDIKEFSERLTQAYRDELDAVIEQAQIRSVDIPNSVSVPRSDGVVMDRPLSSTEVANALSRNLAENFEEAYRVAKAEEKRLYGFVPTSKKINARPVLDEILRLRKSKDNYVRDKANSQEFYRLLEPGLQTGANTQRSGIGTLIDELELQQKIRRAKKENPDLGWEALGQRFGVGKDKAKSLYNNEVNTYVSLQNVLSLRTELGDFVTRKNDRFNASPDKRMGSIATDVWRAVNKAIDEAPNDEGLRSTFTEEDFGNLKVANEFTKAISEKFKENDFIKQVLAASPDEQATISPSAVLDRTFSGGSGSVEDQVTALRNALDFSATKAGFDAGESYKVIEDYIRGRFLRDAVVRDEGGQIKMEATAQGVQKFLTDYEPILKFFRPLQKELEMARDAKDVMVGALRKAESMDARLKRTDDPDGYGLLYAYSGTNPDKLGTMIFDQPMSPGSTPDIRMGQLIETLNTGKNGEKVDQQVWDSARFALRKYLARKANLLIEVDNEYRPNPNFDAVNAAQAVDFLMSERNRNVLRKLFTDNELDEIQSNLELVRNTAQYQNTTGDAFAKNLADDEPNVWAVLTGRLAGARMGAAANKAVGGGASGGAGPSLQASAMASQRMKELVGNLTRGKKTKITVDAIQDPRLMRELLQRGAGKSFLNPANQKDPFRRLPYLRGYIASSLMTEGGQDENEEGNAVDARIFLR